MRLEDKVAVITGASDIFGAAIALGYAKEGADLFLHDFDDKAEGLEKLVAEARETGRRVETGIYDITQMAPTVALAKDVMDKFGRADIMVCATGGGWHGLFFDCTEPEWNRAIDRGLKAQFLANQQIGKEMARVGKGKIINISSITGDLGSSGAIPWSAAKGGTQAMTYAIAQCLGEYGINVVALSRGARDDNPTYTEESIAERQRRLPLGRLGRISDVVGPAIFLASDESQWVTGSVLYVDGGYVSAAATDAEHRVTSPYRGD